MEQIKYIVNIFFNIFLSLFIIFMAGCYLTGAKLLVVTSNSMAPAINKGDLLLIFKNEDYRIDDIISFKNKGKIVTHRVIFKENNLIKTKGDANRLTDFGFIANIDVLGRVEFVIPLIGFLILSLQS